MYVQSNKSAFAPFEINAREGDILRSEKFSDELVIADVNKLSGPGGRMAHAEIKLVSKKEWDRMNNLQQPSSVTHNRNVNTVGAIATAGDVTGPVTVNVTKVHQFFSDLEKHVAADATIPKPEKKSLLTKIKELATSPKVVEYATAIFKGWVGG
jgi:hypothetical protein